MLTCFCDLSVLHCSFFLLGHFMQFYLLHLLILYNLSSHRNLSTPKVYKPHLFTSSSHSCGHMRTTLIDLVTCHIDLKKESAVFKRSDHLPTSFQKADCGTTLHTSLYNLLKLPRMYGQTPHLSFCLSLCNITTLVLKTSIRSHLLNHFWCTNPKKDSRPGGPSVKRSQE